MSKPEVDRNRLIRAIEQGDEAEVQRLVDSGTSPDVVNSEGVAAVFVAIQLRLDRAFRALLGADACQVGADGTSVLHVAASCGTDTAVKNILALPEASTLVNSREIESLDGKPSPGRTPLHWACQSGDLAKVDALLHAGADPNISSHEEGTPLAMAASDGFLEIVDRLLASGADVNGRGLGNATALTLAAAYGHKDVVAFLLENGASPSLIDDEGHSASEYAKQYGHREIVRVLNSL